MKNDFFNVPVHFYRTIKPFWVVLGCAQGWHASQASVYDRIAAWEVDHSCGIQLSALRHHCCGVVTWVIRAACNAVDTLQHCAHVAHLRWWERQKRWSENSRDGKKMLSMNFPKVTLSHTSHYLSGDAQRLESISAAGHDLCFVHQQNSDVILTFNLQRRGERRRLMEPYGRKKIYAAGFFTIWFVSEKQRTKSSVVFHHEIWWLQLLLISSLFKYRNASWQLSAGPFVTSTDALQ